MKKVILIEDDPRYHALVSTICNQLLVPLFPEIKGESNLAMLHEYIGPTNDSDILCICDLNGMRFYQKFLGEGKTVIFASATSDIGEMECIRHFCSEKENRSFLQKERTGLNFELTLAEKIKAFLEA